MSSVAIVDTSVFLNVLNVPGMNANRASVISQLKELIKNNATLLLPMAAVYETGNHIAQLGDGRNRRHFAGKFADEVVKAFDGQAPWRAMKAPTIEQVGKWLSDFADSAMRGHSVGDLSIVKEWEDAKNRTPHLRVFIWSLDRHLLGYDYQPSSTLTGRL